MVYFYWYKSDEFIKFLYDEEKDFSEDEKEKLLINRLKSAGRQFLNIKKLNREGGFEVAVTPSFII